MTANRMFNTLDIIYVNTINAFRTGEFSPEVLSYMRRNNVATIVAKLPKDMHAITLSPEILALEESKLTGMFHALKEHVGVVNFHFTKLKPADFEKFAYLMAYSGYAAHAREFNLQWNFDRFPMKKLQDTLLGRSIPHQLKKFTFSGSIGSENVAAEELVKFKKTKLGKDTEISLDMNCESQFEFK